MAYSSLMRASGGGVHIVFIFSSASFAKIAGLVVRSRLNSPSELLQRVRERSNHGVSVFELLEYRDEDVAADELEL